MSLRMVVSVADLIPGDVHAVVFDVGETLVDESRAWADLAARAGVTSLTLAGVLGAVIERGEDHRRVWDVLDAREPEPDGSGPVDLYPDALECLGAAREAGLVVGIAGNQPAGAETRLRDAGFEADFIASSARWRVWKPSPEFFARVAAAASAAPGHVMYIGDRLDNDVLPARAAGMKTALIRRGPWGYLHSRLPDAGLADARVDSLVELTMEFRKRS